MTEIVAMSFRMPREVIRYLKIRAAQHDRSANKELITLLRHLAETEKAPGSIAKQTPDASTKPATGADQ